MLERGCKEEAQRKRQAQVLARIKRRRFAKSDDAADSVTVLRADRAR